MATNTTWKLDDDLAVNRIGFGAMRITGEGIWGWPPDRQNALKVLRRAVELGVNLIDTADAYGPETSELLIAEALHPYRAGLVIATKGGLTRPGPDDWEPNGRPDYLKGCVEKSLKRLRLERIDLYQLHRVDSKVPMEESLGALKEMQGAGKIRHVGLSEVSPEEIARARKVLPIVSVQNQYNIANRRWEKTLVYCDKEGIGHTRNSGGVRAGVPTRSVRSADFVSNPPRFVFERAGGEFGARVTVAEILLNKRLKATTSFTLSDVDELVQDQFAIAPAIGANNNSMADGRAARSISDDMGEPRGLSELLVVRQRNSIDHQHFHPGTIPNPDSMRIGGSPWP